MKIKLEKLYHNFGKTGISLHRENSNIIRLSGHQDDIPVDILLPEDFELEEQAVSQLMDFANLVSPGGRKMKCACATPDFHKGSSIPVGSVVVSDKDIVIPSAIGTDINCGMRLHHTGMGLSQFMLHKKALLEKLKGDFLEGTRDIPTTDKAMQALFSDGLSAFWQQMKKTPAGMFTNLDYKKVMDELDGLHMSAFMPGNLNYAPENLMNREWMRDPALATLGSGNHFCEIQVVKDIVDRKKAFELGLKVGDVMVMIHTGSRDVGFYVGSSWMDRARKAYPAHLKHPENKAFALEGELVNEYLQAMQTASHYATANRALLAEIFRQRVKEVTGKENNRLIVDVPHNIVIQEEIGNVHRKGATPAYEGQLLLIPGSMGHESFLLSGLGNERWLQSASHGAGRSISRNKMTFKGKKNQNLLGLDGVECITLKEERKIEEAPGAYKEIGPVIQSQVEEKTVEVVAVFSPLVTFKA
jgi:tRNA-splicing ligase RtcB